MTITLGGSELEVAAGLGIKHQGITAVLDCWPLEGNGADLIEGLGVAQVGHQAPQGPQCERGVRETKAVQCRQFVVAQQHGFSVGTTEGSAGDGRQTPSIWTPGWAGFCSAPQQFGRLQLCQVLVKAVAALPLQHAHLTGAHIGAGQTPAKGLFPLG